MLDTRHRTGSTRVLVCLLPSHKHFPSHSLYKEEHTPAVHPIPCKVRVVLLELLSSLLDTLPVSSAQRYRVVLCSGPGYGSVLQTGVCSLSLPERKTVLLLKKCCRLLRPVREIEVRGGSSNFGKGGRSAPPPTFLGYGVPHPGKMQIRMPNKRGFFGIWDQNLR